MLRVRIKNQNDVVTNEGVFQTEQQVDDWYEYNLEFFPTPHTKHVTSIAEEKKEIQRIQESEEALNLGFELMAKIRSMNRRKLKLSLWTQNQFNALLASTVAAQVERALWNGSLTTAKYLMTQMSEFYSDLEIAEIVSEIDTHEAKWSELI